MTEALGWGKYQSSEQPRRFSLPGGTLEALAKSMRDRLDARALRVIGDPQLTVRNMALSPCFNNFPGVMRSLDSPDIDVVVIGETREWEAVEYARDTITAGKKKA